MIHGHSEDEEDNEGQENCGERCSKPGPAELSGAGAGAPKLRDEQVAPGVTTNSPATLDRRRLRASDEVGYAFCFLRATCGCAKVASAKAGLSGATTQVESCRA